MDVGMTTYHPIVFSHAIYIGSATDDNGSFWELENRQLVVLHLAKLKIRFVHL